MPSAPWDLVLRFIQLRRKNLILLFVRYVRLGFLLGKKILAAIPGQGHSLITHSTVLVRGGRCRDIPGIHYKLIRGKYDFITTETFLRTQKRSKYGLKRPIFEQIG